MILYKVGVEMYTHFCFRHGLHGLTRFLVYDYIKFIREIRVIRA